MGLPRAIQQQAQKVEKLIKIEQEYLKRFNNYLNEALAEISPILNDIKEEKKSDNLSFGTALACMKNGYNMTNDRLMKEDRNAAILYPFDKDKDEKLYLVEIPTQFEYEVYTINRSWLPTHEDLTTDDWCFFYLPEDEEE